MIYTDGYSLNFLIWLNLKDYFFLFFFNFQNNFSKIPLMTFSSSLIKILIVITGVAFNKLPNLVYLVSIKHLTLDNFIQGQK